MYYFPIILYFTSTLLLLGCKMIKLVLVWLSVIFLFTNASSTVFIHSPVEAILGENDIVEIGK